MKLKQLLTKTLLIAAGLGVGSSAWSAPTTIYTRSLTDWSSDDITTTDGTVNKWYKNASSLTVDATYGLRVAASQNTTGTATLTTSHTDNTIVTLDAVWNSGHSNSDSNTPHCYFSFGDLTITQTVDTRKRGTSYTINGKTTTLSTSYTENYNALTIHLVVNSYSNEITEFYIKFGETTLAQFSDLTSDNDHFPVGTIYNKVVMTAQSPSNRSQTTENFMTSLTIAEEAQDLDVKAITLKYEDTEGSSLSSYSADRVIYAEEGATIADLIVSAYTTTFYNGTSNKYVYSTYTVDGNYTEVQSAGNTVRLKFTNYPATAYTVKAQVSGSDIATLASGTAYFDGSTTVYFDKFIKEDDQWYEKTDKPYQVAITNATNNFAFVANNDFDDYYDETDLNTTKSYAASYNKDFMSKGKGARLNKSQTAYTNALTAGVYRITIGAGTYSGTPTLKYGYRLNNENTQLGTTEQWKNGSYAATQTFDVLIPEGASFCVYNDDASNNSNVMLDYILVLKSPTASATVGANGYATFASAYPLDLTDANLPDGLKAYKATLSGTTLSFTKLNQTVPAGTGLLLLGETKGGTYNIPVVTEGTAVESNALVGVTEATPLQSTVTGGANVYYFVMKKATTADDALAFAPLSASSAVTVPAGKAYVTLDTSTNPARSLTISFGDEETGISAALSDKGQTTEGIFNLNGQRISQPTKGLYIMNGRKVLMK